LAAFSERHATSAFAHQNMVPPRPADAEDHRRNTLTRCTAVSRLRKRTSAGGDSSSLAHIREQIAAARARNQAAHAQLLAFERTNEYFAPGGRQRWLAIEGAMTQAYHEMIELQSQLPLAANGEETKRALLQSLGRVNQDEEVKRCLVQILGTRVRVGKEFHFVSALHWACVFQKSTLWPMILVVLMYRKLCNLFS
jgi:hypothetical protein